MKHSQRLSFTLIELLVVIAIISVLASMLLPAISKAKQKAQGTACMNNLKQSALGIQLYADDYDDYVPPGLIGDYASWANLISPYLGSAGNTTGITPAWRNYKYAKGIFVCPTDGSGAGEVLTGSTNGHGDDPILILGRYDDETRARASYGYNETLGHSIWLHENNAYQNPWSGHWSLDREVFMYKKRGIVADYSSWLETSNRNTTGKPLVIATEIDESTLPGGYYYMSTRVVVTSDGLAHPDSMEWRHLGRANVIAIDGHVFQLTLSEITGQEYRLPRLQTFPNNYYP